MLAIAASLLSMKLNRSYGSKPVFTWGLIANFIAMVLLALSSLVMHNTSFAYSLLLIATGFLGLGFGLTVPTLNAVAALLYPAKVDSTLLFLNALLGIGTALAPAFTALFIGLGFWWGFPFLLALLIVFLFLFSRSLILPGGNIKIRDFQSQTSLIPHIFGFLELLPCCMESLKH